MRAGVKYPIIGGNWQKHKLKCRSPHLWRDCVFAWNPSTDGSGDIAFDRSGYGNDGTLTNMDPATDRVMTPYGWGLALDGDDDWISTPYLQDLANATVTIQQKYIGAVEPYDAIWYMGDTGANGWGLLAYSTPPIYKILAGGVGWLSFGIAPTTAWNILTVTKVGTTFTLYIDGLYQASGARTYGAPTTYPFYIGDRKGRSTANHPRQVTLATLHSRVLLPSEVASMAADPLAMWTPRAVQISAYVAPAVGAPGQQYYRRLMAG